MLIIALATGYFLVKRMNHHGGETKIPTEQEDLV